MRWDDLAFLHFPVAAESIRAQLPAGVELERYDGSAWLGVVPFRMEDVAARWLPAIPGTRRFLELNLRTYVRVRGRPGVWFFSLDASNPLAVRAARIGFSLPYYDSRMSADGGRCIHYHSRRHHRGVVPGVFDAAYEGQGQEFHAQPGGFEEWLTERYCLFSANHDGEIFCGHVHHRPWTLQRCAIEIRRNTLGNLIGVALGETPAHALFARSLQVIAWAPEPA